MRAMIDAHLEALTNRAIADRIFPGGVLGVIDGQVQDVRAFGSATYDDGAQAITERSIYMTWRR